MLRQPPYEVEGDYLLGAAGEYWVKEARGGVCVVFLFLAGMAGTHKISGVMCQARPGLMALGHLLSFFSAKVPGVRCVVIFSEEEGSKIVVFRDLNAPLLVYHQVLPQGEAVSTQAGIPAVMFVRWVSVRSHRHSLP